MGPDTPPPTTRHDRPPSPQASPASPSRSRWRQRIGLLLGPGLFALMLLSGPPADMDPAAWQVAALTVLMATWWVSEALPIPVTALLPVGLLPLMGAVDINAAAAPTPTR